MRSTSRVAAAVCAAALLLSACGTDEEPVDDVAASESVEPQEEEPSEEPEPSDEPEASGAPEPSEEPEPSDEPEPCPAGTQAIVPGGECNPIPEPEPEPEPQQQEETQEPEPEPTEEPQPASNPCDERDAQSFTTSVGDFFFDPADRSDLCVGDRITFVNDGEISHTATNRGGAFDTGTLSAGDSATITISQAGELRYVCLFHSQMNGTLAVVG